MKLALFSDIHANLPALEAFLANLDKMNPDGVYCLGDLIGYNIWPNEVIAEIRKRNFSTLVGNHDLKTLGYAYELVSDENRNFLHTLPSHIKLEFKLKKGPINFVFAHGSTRSINEYVLDDLDEAYLQEMMSEANADILCIGHSHKPYHRILDRNPDRLKHVINIGSVGKPKDGNPKGCYVLITINEESCLNEPDGIRVEFIRFSYDIEKVVKSIEDSPLPNELGEKLRMGV